MSGKSVRRVALDAVADYHTEQLAILIERVATEIDRYRSGELDAFDADRALFQYSRATRELWKFCNLGNPEITARVIREYPPTDWWERGAPRDH